MRIRIDNLDGRGAVEYTAALSADESLTVTRRLNEPSRCEATLVLEGTELPVPKRRGRVTVSDDAGAGLFSGYIITTPTSTFLGSGTTGSVYTVRLACISDEWLLDQLGPGEASSSLAQSPAATLQQMASRVQGGAATLAVESAAGLRTTGVLTANRTTGWSDNARLAAGAGYAGYRVLGGGATVQPVGGTVHVLHEGDGRFDPAALQLRSVRELANDVTLSGAMEPTAYVTEVFQGDGSTAQFTLTQTAFRGEREPIVVDAFDDASIRSTRWQLTDAGGHLSLGGGGLMLNGGAGTDGETTLRCSSAAEVGGGIVAEARGVVLEAGCDGVLAGFYSGPSTMPNCVAGFRVRLSDSGTGGQTILVPLVNGAEAGTALVAEAEHSYTLRVRLWSPEMHRIAQRYYCMADGQVEGFGSAMAIEAPLAVVLEVVDEGVSTNTPATLLYDSEASGVMIAEAPAQCSFVLVNAVQMFGSIRAVRVDQTGSLRVVSRLPNGRGVTRLSGTAGDSVDCELRYGSDAGVPASVVFFPGRIPVAGEEVFISYRARRRSIARLASATNDGTEASANASDGSRWLGQVISPPARSSEDCESAAQALLAIATSESAALAGSFLWGGPDEDVWPGDLLQITQKGTTLHLLIREVVLRCGHTLPEWLVYSIQFANDWATEWKDGLGLVLSDSVARDTELPYSPAAEPALVLANLPLLRATTVNETSLQVDAGIAAPEGGGFEVRRRDWSFGPGGSADLVLRSPVRSFSIPRVTPGERFFVRMFSGGAAPQYSRWSSALIAHLPVS